MICIGIPSSFVLYRAIDWKLLVYLVMRNNLKGYHEWKMLSYVITYRMVNCNFFIWAHLRWYFSPASIFNSPNRIWGYLVLFQMTFTFCYWNLLLFRCCMPCLTCKYDYKLYYIINYQVPFLVCKDTYMPVGDNVSKHPYDHPYEEATDLWIHLNAYYFNTSNSLFTR